MDARPAPPPVPAPMAKPAVFTAASGSACPAADPHDDDMVFPPWATAAVVSAASGSACPAKDPDANALERAAALNKLRAEEIQIQDDRALALAIQVEHVRQNK